MKIGIVCYPTYGGSGVVATELGKALAEKGHDIHFIAYRQPVRLEHFHERIRFHEVNVVKYPLFEFPPYETALAAKLVDVVKHEKLDLIHVHYAIPHASAAYFAKQVLERDNIYTPLVTTLHGTDITLVGKNDTYGPIVSFSINRSDGVTSVSEYLKEETLKNFDIEQEIEVIPNFIDLQRFNRKNMDHFRKAIAPNGEKILIHTSNFRKVKRVQDVVKVFTKISEKIPARLLLVGDGPERVKIESMCRDKANVDDIRFLGKQQPVEELLAVADLYYMTSEYESFGLAALEAMACEVPVISTNKGGIPEINIDGETGFMSEVGDIDDMAANSLKLLNDEDLLLKFRKQALEQARRFELKNILPLYEDLYERVIEESKANV